MQILHFLLMIDATITLLYPFMLKYALLFLMHIQVYFALHHFFYFLLKLCYLALKNIITKSFTQIKNVK